MTYIQKSFRMQASYFDFDDNNGIITIQTLSQRQSGSGRNALGAPEEREEFNPRTKGYFESELVKWLG